MLGPGPGPEVLGPVLASLEPGPGPVAMLSVGWRESDLEASGLRELPGWELEPLSLGERVRRAFEADPELAEAHAELQRAVRAEEALYGLRLRQAVEASHAVGRAPAPDRYRVPYEREAWAALLQTDDFHLKSQRSFWDEFRRRVRPRRRPALETEREQALEILDRAAAVVITGGHVAMIRNRLLLLDLGEALARKPIVAWSAGAMALTRRVVLFHDRLPWGSARPEILGDGLGLFPGVAFFPDAGARLALRDREHLADLAGRVRPEVAVLLDPGDRIDWDGSRWSARSGVRALDEDGGVQEREALS